MTPKSPLSEGHVASGHPPSDDPDRSRYEHFRLLVFQPQGLPAEILTLALVGERVRLCVSAEIHSEYEEVIRRPRFRRSEQEIADALRAIRESGLWIKPSQQIRACSDPDDDVFLGCAHAANADFLVTGNLKHFLASWRDTKVVSARQFLDALAEVQQ